MMVADGGRFDGLCSAVRVRSLRILRMLNSGSRLTSRDDLIYGFNVVDDDFPLINNANEEASNMLMVN